MPNQKNLTPFTKDDNRASEAAKKLKGKPKYKTRIKNMLYDLMNEAFSRYKSGDMKEDEKKWFIDKLLPYVISKAPQKNVNENTSIITPTEIIIKSDDN